MVYCNAWSKIVGKYYGMFKKGYSEVDEKIIGF